MGSVCWFASPSRSWSRRSCTNGSAATCRVPNHAGLVILTELIEAGKLRPVIDQTHPLSEITTALHSIEAGHVRGKVVITVADHADRAMVDRVA